MSIDHPVLLELNSLKQALSQFQHESHSTSIKLQHASLSLSNLQQLQQTNTLLSSELSTLRSHSPQFSTSSSSGGLSLQESQRRETVEGLTLSLRELSSKLSICEEQLLGKIKELGLLNLEMKKSRSMTESAYELASRIRGREESSKSYSLQLQLKLDLAEEKNRMSERALLEYANLVRSLSDKSRTSTTTRQIHPSQVQGNDDRRVEELLKEHIKEKEVLEKRISELEYSLDVANASLNSDKKAQEETLSHVVELEGQLMKIERDDSTAGKMVSRYMKFTQKQTEGLHTTLTALQTRHQATLSTLHSQISTLSSLLNDSSNDNTRLRNALDELGLEILKESYGRRREVVQRIKLVRREERIVEGLRRWLRKSEERLRRLEGHAKTDIQMHSVQEEMMEMIQDAKIIVDALNSPSFSSNSHENGSENENEPLQFILSGSNTKFSLIQSHLEDLVNELQMEKERRVSLEVMLVKGVEDDHVQWHNGDSYGVEPNIMNGQDPEKKESRKHVGTQTMEERTHTAQYTNRKDTISLFSKSLPKLPIDETLPTGVVETPTHVPETKDVGADMVNVEPELVRDETEVEGISVGDVDVEVEDEVVEVKADVEAKGEDGIEVDVREEADLAIEAAVETKEDDVIEAKYEIDVEPNENEVEVEVETEEEIAVEVLYEGSRVEIGAVAEEVKVDDQIAEENLNSESLSKQLHSEIEAVGASAIASDEAEVNVEAEINIVFVDEVDSSSSSSDNAPEREHLVDHALTSSDAPSSPVRTPSPRAPPRVPSLISLPTTLSSLSPPSPPPPTHPLLTQLKATQTRYDHLQRAFHDCHIALEDLKSSLSSNTTASSQVQPQSQNSISFPSGDNKKEEQRKGVLKAIVSRLDDFTEDIRVELEIRIADEQVLGVGYEALLLVPGALLSSSSSTNVNPFPSSSSFSTSSSTSTDTVHNDNSHHTDDEPIPNTKTLESQIQSFIDGTDPVISKALHTFEKKLDDLVHDLSAIKRAVYDPSSSSSPNSPSTSPPSSPSPSSPLPSTDLPLPIDTNTNTSTEEKPSTGTGGGWTSWIRTPTSSLLSLPSTLNMSRPSTPTPSSSSSASASLKPMTFGEIMTSPRKPPPHTSHLSGSGFGSGLNRSTSNLSLKSASSVLNLKGGGGGVSGGGGRNGRRESLSQNQNQNQNDILKNLNLNLNLNLRIQIPLSHLPVPINHSVPLTTPHRFAGQKGLGLGLPLHLQQEPGEVIGTRMRTTSSSSMYRLGMGMGMGTLGSGGFGTGIGIGGGFGIGMGMGGMGSSNHTPRRVVSAFPSSTSSTSSTFASKGLGLELGSAPVHGQDGSKVNDVGSDDEDEDEDEEREDID